MTKIIKNAPGLTCFLVGLVLTVFMLIGPDIVGAKTESPSVDGKKVSAEKASATKLAPGQKININTASKEQLKALPGIGSAKAQAIIDGRPYKTIDDIKKVKSIKQKLFDKIKDSITVG